MTYRELLPPRALRRHVDRFWCRTDSAEPPASAAPVRILPDGCIDVLIDVRTGAARVVGTMTRALVHSLGPEDSLAAVRFRPGGARPFLGISAAELTDRTLPVEELGLRWLAPAEPRGIAGCLDHLERELLRRVREVTLHQEVAYATRRLLGAGPPRIEELARELGRSRQQLGRTFRQHVGISPKLFAEVARLQRAIDLVQADGDLGLARAALQLGYCDQAHMSNDFRVLAGLSPRAARTERGSISPIRSLWLEA